MLDSEVPGILLALLVAISAVFTIMFSAKSRIEPPSLGRMNWADATFLLGSLSVFPFVVLLVPQVVTLGFISLAFLGGLYSIIRSYAANRGLALLLSVSVIAIQFIVRNLWLNDALVILVLSSAAVLFVKGGMKIRELAYMISGYAVIDILAAAYFQSTVARIVATFPLVPIVAVQVFGQQVAIGGGDIFLVGISSLAISSSLGWSKSLAYLLAVGLAVVLLLTFVPYTSVPLGPVLASFFLAFFAVSKLGQPVSSEESRIVESELIG